MKHDASVGAVTTAAEPPDQLAGSGASLGDWIALLRPRQWVKNVFVLAPLLFSGRLLDGAAIWAAVGAFVMFCFLASGVYAINDVADAERDRLHPTKQNRPVAARKIAPRFAVGVGLFSSVIAGTIGWFIDPRLVIIAATYVVLNVGYSVGLKHVVILDVFALAAFFILRLLAGAVAIHAVPSIWLLLCGGLLALYLGFAKRRHELLETGSAAHRQRTVLAEYGKPFLDQMSMVLLAVTIMSYIMYTVSPEKVAEVGYALTVSIVFVLYGIFRYLYLVYQRDRGNPTETLLSDRALIVNGLLWTLYCGMVIYGASLQWW